MKVDKIEYVIESEHEYMYMYVICVWTNQPIRLYMYP